MTQIQAPIIPLGTKVTVAVIDLEEHRFTDYYSGKVISHPTTNQVRVVYTSEDVEDDKYFDKEAVFTYRIWSNEHDHSCNGEWHCQEIDAVLTYED